MSDRSGIRKNIPPDMVTGYRTFMLDPNDFLQVEQRIKYHLRRLQVLLTGGYITKKQATDRGHELLDQEKNRIIAQVNRMAERSGLPTVSPYHRDILEGLEKAKEAWTRVVNDIK